MKVTDIDAAKVEYLLNDIYGLYSSEFTVINPGFYKLTVTTDDGYGYVKQKSIEFKIDNIKPTAALFSEAKEWQNTDISVVPSYNDTGYSGLMQSMYEWSNDLDIPSEWNNYAGGNLVQTQDGIWYLHMKAVDGAGNVTVQTYGPYGIDRIAPSLSIEPAERDWDNADVGVTPLYTDEGGSNIKSAVYSWTISPDTTGSLDNHTAGDIVQSRDGVWYLYIKVEDNAGNVTESAYGVYKVDKTPPVVTAAPNSTEWVNTDILVEPQFTDGNGSGIYDMWYAWSGSESVPSSWEEYVSGPLAQTQEGVWYLHMKASDNTGNEAVYTFGPYKLDKTAPTISADTTSRETWESTAVAVTTAYADEGGSQIKYFKYSWSLSPDMPSEWTTYTSGGIEVSQDGEWFLHLMAEDNAGNTTTISYGPYRVDKTPPVITHSFTDEYTYLDTINLGYTAFDETSGIAGSSISLNGVTSENGADVQLVWPGSCNIEMTAQDLAGNTTTVIKTISIVVQAEIDVNPNTVNARENGNEEDKGKDKDNGGGMMTVFIGFPEGVDINDIIHGTIRLNGVYSPISDPKYGFVSNPVADHDGDGKVEYMIKFRRDEILDELVRCGGSITISGSAGSYDFRGVDLVEIKN